MLARGHRLPGNRLTLILTAKPYQTPALNLKVVPTKPDQPTRIGVLVSSRISTKAVDRHRLKRQLRHLMTVYLPQIRPGYDLLLIVRPGIKNLNPAELKTQLGLALVKLNLFYETTTT